MLHVGLTCHQVDEHPRVTEPDAAGRAHYVVRDAMVNSQHVSRASRVTLLVMGLVIGLNGWTTKTENESN